MVHRSSIGVNYDLDAAFNGDLPAKRRTVGPYPDLETMRLTEAVESAKMGVRSAMSEASRRLFERELREAEARLDLHRRGYPASMPNRWPEAVIMLLKRVDSLERELEEVAAAVVAMEGRRS